MFGVDILMNFSNLIEKNLYYSFSVLNTRWGCGLEGFKIPLDRKAWYEPSRPPDGYNSALKS